MSRKGEYSMLQDLYAQIGGSYAEIKHRLMTDSLIEKFVLRFPADPTYNELCAAMSAQDAVAAFASAHTLKGIALSLSFDELAQAATMLTDALRESPQCDNDWPQLHILFTHVDAAFTRIIAAIAAYQGE